VDVSLTPLEGEPIVAVSILVLSLGSMESPLISAESLILSPSPELLQAVMKATLARIIKVFFILKISKDYPILLPAFKLLISRGRSGRLNRDFFKPCIIRALLGKQAGLAGRNVVRYRGRSLIDGWLNP
jgi:hypothetical protein